MRYFFRNTLITRETKSCFDPFIMNSTRPLTFGIKIVLLISPIQLVGCQVCLKNFKYGTESFSWNSQWSLPLKYIFYVKRRDEFKFNPWRMNGACPTFFLKNGLVYFSEEWTGLFFVWYLHLQSLWVLFFSQSYINYLNIQVGFNTNTQPLCLKFSKNLDGFLTLI